MVLPSTVRQGVSIYQQRLLARTRRLFTVKTASSSAPRVTVMVPAAWFQLT